MDRLSDILSRFSVNAGVFFSGNLCGIQVIDQEKNEHGHLHLLKSGQLTVLGAEGVKIILDKPSLVFFPRSTRHRLIADQKSGADLVCAQINYQDSFSNPLANALPTFLHYDLEKSDLLSQSAVWLFEEAFNDRCGRQPMINRLCDIFLINVLRQILDDGSIAHGMMAGLAHPQLARILSLIHKNPQQAWPLETMAEMAGMSRSKFAATFRAVLGQTPGDYIADWRITIAKDLLIKKQPVGLVANTVGYENGSTLARVFRKRTGLSPREWLGKLK